MKIAVVGLGLIGGSFCRAIKKYTNHECFGIDIDKNAVIKAEQSGAIDKGINTEELIDMDLTVISLYPDETITFIKKNAPHFKKQSIVIDVCGVKNYVVTNVEKILRNAGVNFVPTHPMAGRENWGFDSSTPDLFDKASLIITPTPHTSQSAIKIVKQLAMSLKFEKIVTSTPKEHDAIIAFTSQLAHIVSSAYIKSPRAKKQNGFSAGSYKDLTRVAKLNEEMWSTLFLANKTPLLNEIDILINHLSQYRDAISNGDKKILKKLLKEGRLRKESID